MKVIIVYSGKGGVGKTTTSANIARALSTKGKKVFILDADVNTPSMPVIFPEKTADNITVASLGYDTNKTIYVTNSTIRSYISDCIDDINRLMPDFVIIDTPPSITDVHINLLDKIKPSGMIVVTQPNALSVSDINRTVLFFQERGVGIIGIVENMKNVDEPTKYTWDVLATVPFEQDFNFNTVYKNNLPLYEAISDQLIALPNEVGSRFGSVILENKKRQIFDETITTEDIDNMPFNSKNDIHFVNLKTWGYVKEIIEDFQDRSGGMIPHDEFLSFQTPERLKRVVECFETDDRAFFMVTKAPGTEIKLLPGEIGEGTLTIAKSYYGVPRIKYSTAQGEVVLFAHEIIPVSRKEIIQYTGSGYIPTKDGRYLPPKADVKEVYECFGGRVGISENWEELYDNIIQGNLPKIDESMANVTEAPSKKRSYKKERTIKDIKVSRY